MAYDVGVVGGGTMGVGIAYRFAVTGANVRLADIDLASAESAVERVHTVLDRSLAREKLSAKVAAAASQRLKPVASVTALPERLDVVVESVFEDEVVKGEVLRFAEERNPAVLASNTSGISIDVLASYLDDATCFAGMHFFNPVWAIDLVEVIRGSATSEATIDAVLGLASSLGMEAAVVRDAPGFASTRLGLALGLEAVRMVEQGVAAPEDIDRAMVLGYRHAMGPLRTGDLVGWDVRLAIAEHLCEEYGDRYAPPELLRAMVAEGRLGKKTGRGFYDWD